MQSAARGMWYILLSSPQPRFKDVHRNLSVLLILSPRRADKRTRKKSCTLSALSRNGVARRKDSKLRAGITILEEWSGMQASEVQAASHGSSLQPFTMVANTYLDRRAQCCGTRTAWGSLMNAAVQSSSSHIAGLGFLCRERVWLPSWHEKTLLF